MHACVYTHTHVCIPACVQCAHTHIHTYTHIPTRCLVRVHTCIYGERMDRQAWGPSAANFKKADKLTRIHTFMIYNYTHICAYVHAYTHAYTHSCMHARMHACMHACVRACIYIDKYTYARMHIDTYTYARMHIRTYRYGHTHIHTRFAHTCRLRTHTHNMYIYIYI
jgi:hypothetical protein